MIHYVLSVGGARGSVQAGALQYLDSLGMKGQAFYGSSVGALNAAMMATGQLGRMIEVWEDVENERVYNRNPNIWNFALSLFGRPVLDTSPLKELIRKELLGHKVLHPLTVEFTHLSGELITHKIMGEIGEQDVQFIYDSCAIPFLFGLDDNKADGGLVNPIPLKAAIEAASPGDEIIIISCHPMEAKFEVPETRIQELGAVLDIMQSSLVKASVSPFLMINRMLDSMGVDEFEGLKRFKAKFIAPERVLEWGMLDFNESPKHIWYGKEMSKSVLK